MTINNGWIYHIQMMSWLPHLQKKYECITNIIWSIFFVHKNIQCKHIKLRYIQIKWKEKQQIFLLYYFWNKIKQMLLDIFVIIQKSSTIN